MAAQPETTARLVSHSRSGDRFMQHLARLVADRYGRPRRVPIVLGFMFPRGGS
jgi:hypothetical protein